MREISSFLYLFMSFSTGAIISSAIYAFLTVIGLIPRLILKTKTDKYIVFYENVIILSGVLSALTYTLHLQFSIPIIFVWYILFCLGIFTGSLAVCLAEVMDILPIIVRKFGMANDTKLLMVLIGVGKGLGAFIFYFFKVYKNY